MTAEFLSGALAVLLSLFFGFFPVVKKWYEGLTAELKSIIMIVGLLLIALFTYGASCLGWASGLGLPEVACTEEGALLMAKTFFIALGANQGTYLATRAFNGK